MEVNAQKFDDMARALLNGDEDALEFNRLLRNVLHIWDDLIDQDKPLSDQDINGAFRAALVLIPTNPFYRKHWQELSPLIDAAILSWRSATAMERNSAPSEDDLRIAFICRSDYMNVFLRSVQIIRGQEFAAQIAPDVRRVWHSEGWQGYLAALQAEREKRESNV